MNSMEGCITRGAAMAIPGCIVSCAQRGGRGDRSGRTICSSCSTREQSRGGNGRDAGEVRCEGRLWLPETGANFVGPSSNIQGNYHASSAPRPSHLVHPRIHSARAWAVCGSWCHAVRSKRTRLSLHSRTSINHMLHVSTVGTWTRKIVTARPDMLPFTSCARSWRLGEEEEESGSAGHGK
jgi:hypothetical protein